MTDKPIVIAENNPLKSEIYAMQCKITVGNGNRWCEFDGFASLDVVNSMMDIMREIAKK